MASERGFNINTGKMLDLPKTFLLGSTELPYQLPQDSASHFRRILWTQPSTHYTICSHILAITTIIETKVKT